MVFLLIFALAVIAGTRLAAVQWRRKNANYLQAKAMQQLAKNNRRK